MCYIKCVFATAGAEVAPAGACVCVCEWRTTICLGRLVAYLPLVLEDGRALQMAEKREKEREREEAGKIYGIIMIKNFWTCGPVSCGPHPTSNGQIIVHLTHSSNIPGLNKQHVYNMLNYIPTATHQPASPTFVPHKTTHTTVKHLFSPPNTRRNGISVRVLLMLYLKWRNMPYTWHLYTLLQHPHL